ncbi:hypothetical protein [Kribbella sp. NPDC023855]|uniref:hypothetical protein n=1 Tax=Kribbella sp. NPDC023855 TaxID=3154698 RepID=UPI0033D91499
MTVQRKHSRQKAIVVRAHEPAARRRTEGGLPEQLDRHQTVVLPAVDFAGLGICR